MLHSVEGMLRRSEPTGPATDGRQAAPQQYEPTDLLSMSHQGDDDHEQCHLGYDNGGELAFVANEMISRRYGYLLDLSFGVELMRRFKIFGNALANEKQPVAASEEAKENKPEASRAVPALKQRLMKYFAGLPPWEEQMQRALNDGVDKSELPLPLPSNLTLKNVASGPPGCEAFQTRELKRIDGKNGTVVWSTWIRLETTSPSEGFKISRLSTAMSNFIPGFEPKLDSGRLKKMEARAERILPEASETWTDAYLMSVCETQLDSYMNYIAREEDTHGDEQGLEYDIRSILTWLLPSKTNSKIYDYLKDVKQEPITRIRYGKMKMVHGPVLEDWVLY
ncbi:hypothetical protein FOZ60_006531 [Perkinsus olseni]|uniref:Uncharacterized protein n=1 Tax=Perkinsus olseni TaxID=32597 RepID=A0A7J6NNP3_PEROL|nr:hypothetical protein FOZ60_006531 [Perkinsus olseni]